MRKNVIIVIAMILLVHALPVNSGWLDDWYADATKDSPRYYQGHERGYWSGGGFSYKMRPRNDYLMTVTPPRIRVGCGGIDILSGGLGFLNGKLLMTKLQGILSAAPVAAFDIALNTLCEPCAKAIKAASAFSDALNSMQLNDCMAAKGAVATVMKVGFDAFGMEAQSNKMAAIQSEFMQKSGMSNLWSEVKDKTDKSDGEPLIDLKQKLLACDQEIVDVFGTSGSILEHMGKKMGVSDTQMIDMMRGYVGDVFVKPLNNQIVPDFRGPCPQNEGDGADSLLNGTLNKMDGNGNCTAYQGRNIKQIVSGKMERIADRMRKREKLSAADEDFLRSSPLNVGLNLKMAVRIKQEESIIEPLSDLAAHATALSILTDFTQQCHIITEKINHLAVQKTATKGQCDVSLIANSLQAVEKLQKASEKLQKRIQQGYQTKLAEYRSLATVMERNRLFLERQDREISERFGGAISARVL